MERKDEKDLMIKKIKKSVGSLYGIGEEKELDYLGVWYGRCFNSGFVHIKSFQEDEE